MKPENLDVLMRIFYGPDLNSYEIYQAIKT